MNVSRKIRPLDEERLPQALQMPPPSWLRVLSIQGTSSDSINRANRDSFTRIHGERVVEPRRKSKIHVLPVGELRRAICAGQ